MSFSQFLIFVSEQWLLVFALLLSLNLLLFTESRKAGPALSPQQAINLTNKSGGIFLDELLEMINILTSYWRKMLGDWTDEQGSTKNTKL